MIRGIIREDEIVALIKKYERKVYRPNNVTMEEIMYQEGAKAALEDVLSILRQTNAFGD